jgi:transposase
MNIEKHFFNSPESAVHRQYEALRAFYYEEKPAKEVAERFGYTVSSFYSLTRDFKKAIRKNDVAHRFFTSYAPGRKPKEKKAEIDNEIIMLRKKYLPVNEIKTMLDAKQIPVCESYIYSVIKKEGFERLPRRDRKAKRSTDSQLKITAPKSELLNDTEVDFNTSAAGVLCFLPYIKRIGIDTIINKSAYPGTKTIPTLNSILCFIALKLSDFARYTKDDLWCMDRGLGLFAGLNVLPKAAWYSSYSHTVTREMNLDFLKSMTGIWKENNLLSDTANLDFTTIPYWGEDSHLENNWSGKRNKAMSSILAVLAHDPESGIITYGDTGVRHSNESNVILEFLDFYKECGSSNLKYLVFDSKFTAYENLGKLDDDGIKFITIRRRGKNIVKELEAIPASEWKRVRVMTGDGRKRSIKVVDKTVFLKGCRKDMRQIAITGHGKIKPALILTNDFSLSREVVVRKYARRWLIEKTISDNIYFFHLNKVSSSMVIKVDFDLAMSVLAYNLYRLLAMDLEGYGKNSPGTIYDKFVRNSGTVEIDLDTINVKLKKKRNLPLLLTTMKQQKRELFPWLSDRTINFNGATHT